MSLSVQVLQKIRILLDKPIAPLPTKRIIELVQKQIIPVQQLLWIFLQKHRGDLLLYLVRKYSIPSLKTQSTLESICSQLLKYRIEQIKQVWAVCMSKQQSVPFRKQWGTDMLLRQIVKNTNQQLKSALLTLLIANSKVLWGWGQGRIIQDLTRYFTSIIIKYNFYLPQAPELLRVLLQISSQTKVQLFDKQLKAQLLARLVDLLTSVKERQVFSFQNQCLLTLASLFNQKNCDFADSIDYYSCEKIVEHFLYRKPTRQAARTAKQAYIRAKEVFLKQNAQKMLKIAPKQKQKQQKDHILIENVIEKANQYRGRQHLLDIGQEITYQDRFNKKESFLKKGIGRGGGKVSLQKQKSSTPLKKSRVCQVQDLVQRCIASVNVEKSDIKRQTWSHKANFEELWKRKQALNQPGSKSYQQIMHSQHSTLEINSTTPLQQSIQFQEINNLIELAYKYKFSSAGQSEL